MEAISNSISEGVKTTITGVEKLAAYAATHSLMLAILAFTGLVLFFSKN